MDVRFHSLVSTTFGPFTTPWHSVALIPHTFNASESLSFVNRLFEQNIWSHHVTWGTIE